MAEKPSITPSAEARQLFNYIMVRVPEVEAEDGHKVRRIDDSLSKQIAQERVVTGHFTDGVLTADLIDSGWLRPNNGAIEVIL